MAGRHVGSIQNSSFQAANNLIALANYRVLFPGTKPDAAYAEGRMLKIQNPAATPTNPHPFGTDAYYGFLNGAVTIANPPVVDNDAAIIVVQSGTLVLLSIPSGPVV